MPETPFTDEFEKMLIHENGEEQGRDYFNKMYLTDYDGCIHDDYIDEDVTGEIRNKFANILWFIAQKLQKEGHVKEMPRPVVDASWEDTTHYLLISRPDGQVLFESFCKAWNYKFESKEELEAELWGIWDDCLDILGNKPSKEAILKFLREHEPDPEFAEKLEEVMKTNRGMGTEKTIVVFTVPEEDVWNAIVLEHDEKLKDGEVEERMRIAINEFLRTEEGRKIYEDNSNDFNWGDALIHVPAEFWERHGLRVVLDDYRIVGRYHDENLYREG